MTPFPLVLSDSLGHWGQYVVYIAIGFAFGFVLEIAGFGNSKKLAAQFYLREMTVLKVMFTAIVVAMVLIFLASGLGLLDYNLIWVNPTYLWPGIVGGLIMGVGFIVGGFCPGTSLVAAATAKLDGLFFAIGVLFGVFVFGETVENFEGFFNSSYQGRYTLPELFGVSTGVIVLGVVIMALAAFAAAELSERYFGKKNLALEPKWRYAAAGLLVMAGSASVIIGQPTTQDRWNSIRDEKGEALAARAVQIHPVELVGLIHHQIGALPAPAEGEAAEPTAEQEVSWTDIPRLKVIMLDVRNEADYNLFHILDARHVPLDEIPNIVPALHEEPENTVFVVMSNDEQAATAAWKTLVAESLPNVYILDGGINNWIATFATPEFLVAHPILDAPGDDLHYMFTAALGDRYPEAQPSAKVMEAMVFEPKVKLEVKRGPTGGGCG
jgi:rhodanese-related sulfurtransferase